MKKYFVLVIVIAFITSCQKDDYQVEIKNNYAPLEIGNYWIYENYIVDSIGNETETSIIDSVVITRDTIINSMKYFILEGTNYPFIRERQIIDILRDSLGYLVNSKGRILFSENNFIDTLYKRVELSGVNDTIFTCTYKMENPNYSVTVKAGTFEVLNFKGTLFRYINLQEIENPKYTNTYYADNVGKILETYLYLNSLTIIERRLLRYYIQE